MKIDLRIPILIAAFYTPGLLVLIGAWALGYSTEEAREVVAFVGLMAGASISLPAGVFLYMEHGPIWWTIPNTGGNG